MQQLTTLHHLTLPPSLPPPPPPPPPHQSGGKTWVKFFYQLGPGDFIPVSVVGPPAVYFSNCLHSIVDELLRIRNKKDIRQPEDEVFSVGVISCGCGII